MKVLLLGFTKISYMPYLQFYIKNLSNAEDLTLDLVYWNRDGECDSEIPERIHQAYKFEEAMSDCLAFHKKIRFFIKYRKFAKKIISQNRYDRIISLHTTPGLTILDVLLFRYRRKFVLDFRDITYEYNRVYRTLVGWMVKSACFTYISSEAFKQFLPKNGRFYSIHNFSVDALLHRNISRSRAKEKEALNIVFWGFVRQYEFNAAFIDQFGGDPRFEIHYYGRLQEDGEKIRNYAEKCKYDNVFFHGSYLPEERYGFAAETDLIHNVYDNGYTTGNAMGNKYYDGVIFGIPQLCLVGTQMGKLVAEQEVGFCIDLNDENVGDQVWEYYHSLNWDSFYEKCDAAVRKFTAEQESAEKILLEFVKN